LKDLHVLPITRALIAGLLPENQAIENQAIESQVIAEAQIEAVQDLQEAVLVVREMTYEMKTEE
jgi:hypothetical protein